MKIGKKELIFVSLIVLVSLGFWQIKVRANQTTIQNEKTVQKYEANLTVDDVGEPKNYDISDYIGKTALDATKANAEVVASGTGKNAFVTSIDGKAADTTKREFWELDVNGMETPVGAGSYLIKNGDQIVWKITNY